MGLQDREYMRPEPIKPLPPIVPWWAKSINLPESKPIMAWYCDRCKKYVKTKAKYTWFGGGKTKPVCAECSSKHIRNIEYVQNDKRD